MVSFVARKSKKQNKCKKGVFFQVVKTQFKLENTKLCKETKQNKTSIKKGVFKQNPNLNQQNQEKGVLKTLIRTLLEHFFKNLQPSRIIINNKNP